MTDVEAKTSTKRKNFSKDGKGSAKKAKFDNVNIPGKGISPKQKFNKKNKRTSESENASPKKLKPFPGTQAAGRNTEKKVKVVQKKDKTDTTNLKKKKKNQYHHLGLKVQSDSDKEDALNIINAKLKEFESRTVLSKTARRKMKVLQRLKRIAQGELPEQPQQKAPHSKSEATKRRERKKNAKALSAETKIEKNKSEEAVQQSNNVKTNGKANKNKAQNKKVAQITIPQKQVEQDEDDSDDDSDSDAGVIHLEDGQSSDENVAQEESGEEQVEGESDEEDEDAEEESDEVEEEGSDEDEEEGSDEDEEGSDEEEEEVSLPPPKIKRNGSLKDVSSNKKQKTKTNNKKEFNEEKSIKLEQLKENNLVVSNQKRFVLFVGNITYDTNKLDLIEHFKKSGEIKHIRIPTDKKTSKPRGFAFLELTNEESYQKCLSMHHTFLKGRRINVLYTQGGKKKGEDKKKEIKAKNFKLHAMRKEGKLAGSKKQTQKRSFRRAKGKAARNENEGQQD